MENANNLIAVKALPQLFQYFVANSSDFFAAKGISFIHKKILLVEGTAGFIGLLKGTEKKEEKKMEKFRSILDETKKKDKTKTRTRKQT